MNEEKIKTDSVQSASNACKNYLLIGWFLNYFLYQTDAVPAPDVRLKILENQLRESGSAVEKMKIEFQIFQLLQLKENINKTMEKIVTESITSEAQKMRVLGSHAYPVDFDCYKKAVEAFSENCYNLGQVSCA